MVRSNVFKTEIRLVVLSEAIDPDVGRSAWLLDIAHAIDDGDSIGDWKVESQRRLAPAEVEPELLAIGNDGAFFQDD